MARERTGSVKYCEKLKKWRARLTAVDETGKRLDIRRLAPTKTAANLELKRMMRDLDDHGPQIIEGERLTFAKLASIYSGHKLQEPVYKGETKVSGMRSWKNQLVFLKPLVDHFGRARIRAITHAELEKYKAKRIETPTRRGADRSIAGVNRELSLLRAILNYARRSGWLVRNPFEMGESIISHADENKRDRIITFDEEARLLEACTGPRAHLRALIITAIDTAMRRGEMLKLTWSDVDFDRELIRVRKTTTKTWEARTVGMTARVKDELLLLFEAAPPDPAGLVFGLSGMKRSFATACRLAGIDDLHWHDLRHVGTSRMIASGMAPLEAMKITGHKQMTTFLRYLNVDAEAARRAARSLDAYRDEEEMESGSEFIN